MWVLIHPGHSYPRSDLCGQLDLLRFPQKPSWTELEKPCGDKAFKETAAGPAEGTARTLDDPRVVMETPEWRRIHDAAVRFLPGQLLQCWTEAEEGAPPQVVPAAIRLVHAASMK